MKDEIRTALAPLVGLRFVQPGRGLDLQLWEFSARSKPGYALHVGCPWRIIVDDRILVGYGDYYRSATVAPLDESERTSGTGARWIDVQLAVLRGRLGPDGARVESVEADGLGGFSLVLSEGIRIEVMPDTSCAPHDKYDEYWRVFEQSDNAQHFVVTASGIQGRE